MRIGIQNFRREDGQSTSLLIGKAAEHLVCCDLILSGRNAMMADAGQPYDILVDSGDGVFTRVAVKGTTRMYNRAGHYPVYRFGLRKTATRTKLERRGSVKNIDVFALVALDRKLIAYVPVADLTHSSGGANLIVEFKTRSIEYLRQKGRSGNDPAKSGKWIEDYADFPTPLSGGRK